MNVPRSATERQRVAAHSMQTAPEVADLLLRIVGQVGDEPAPSAPGSAAPGDQEVLLDLQIDGTRYTLIRTASDAHPPVSLSPREREIVRLIAKGLPNKAIATVLDISLWTVATYIRRMFAKLGVNSRAEMVARVLKDGLLNEAD